MNKITTTLLFERSTRGSHFFVELDESGQPVERFGGGGTIKSLYVRKTAMPSAPRTIRVTIEQAD